MEDSPQDAARQQRILEAYRAMNEPKAKSKPEPIASLEEIIETSPGISRVREYYRTVLENISNAEKESFLK